MKQVKRCAALAALAATALLAFGGVAVAETAPDFTPAGFDTMGTCSAKSQNGDSGAGYLKEAADRRPGPGTNCGTFGSVKKGTLIQYHCKYASWTHGRIDGISGANGWFYSPKFDDGGSNVACKQ